MSELSLSFYGGAGMVTGANFLLKGPTSSILVDCGLKQGCNFCEAANREPFPYEPKEVETLIVTHAHLDHIGRIPKLVADGFEGTIYSTPATREIAEVVFKDGLKIMHQEAEREGVEPLYTEADVARALSLWKEVLYHRTTELPGGFSFNFKDAGHILGSVMVELFYKGEKIVFTGDLGNSPSPLLRDTESVGEAAYLIMESVYGDRNHEPSALRNSKLREVIARTIDRGGVLLIPAFSIERTQILLYEINTFIESGAIPRVPVFLDSPMAIAVTGVYKERIQSFKAGVQEEIAKGDDIFTFPGLTMTRTVEESKEINFVSGPKIIIAGSGMSNGGRILHHERRYLGDPKNTMLIVGYQAAGSLGRVIQDGAKEVTIFDDKVKVRARVVSISGYSAHKDSDRLVEFVEGISGVRKVFVAMGEPKSSLFLVQRLRDTLGLDAHAPREGETCTLNL